MGVFDYLKQATERAGEAIKTKVNGLREPVSSMADSEAAPDLRTQANTPAEAAARQAAGQTTKPTMRVDTGGAADADSYRAKVDAFNQRQGGVGNIDPSIEARAAADEAAHTQRVNAMNQRQGLRAAAEAPGRAEYRAWGAPEAAAPDPIGERSAGLKGPSLASKAEEAMNARGEKMVGGLRDRAATVAKNIGKVGSAGKSLVGWGLKKAPYVGAALEGANLYGKATDDSLSTGDKAREFARSGLRAGGAALGGAAGFILGGPVGAAAVGYGGYSLGDEGAEALLGKEKGRNIVKDAISGMRDKPMPPAQKPASDAADGGGTMSGRSSIDGTETLNGQTPGPATAKADNGLRVGRYGVPGVQSGATGNEQAQYNAQLQKIDDDRTRAQGTRQGGVFGDIAALGAGRQVVEAASAKERGMRDNVRQGLVQQGQVLSSAAQQEAHDVQRETNQANTRVAQSRLGYEMGKDNEGRIKESTADKARAAFDQANPGLISSATGQAAIDAKQKLEKHVADYQSMVNTSAANHGIPKGQMTDAQHQKILLGIHTAKDRLQKVWASGAQPEGLRDFVGSNRFTSNDAFSYLPKQYEKDGKTYVEPAERKGDGYYVTMGNGSKIRLSRVTNKDGSTGLNFFGANDPIDADMMEAFMPAIRAAEAKDKGKR